MRTLRFLVAGAVALSVLWACNDKEETEPTPEPTPGPDTEYDEAYYAENATISSSDAHFTATEQGGEIAYKVEGGEVVVNVDCGVEWTAEVAYSDAEGWLDAAVNCDAGTLTLTAEQNTVEAEKTATVTVMTAESGIDFATISVSQNAYGACEITVEANEWNAPAVGDLTTEIAVEATADWEITNTAEWLTAEKTDIGVKLTASENEETEGRTAEVVLTCTDGVSTDSETITVTQDAKAYITIAEGSEELTFAAEGGSETIEVESNYDWTPSTDETWITVSNNGNTLTVVVSENESEESREGTITITAGDGAENVAKATITVSQAEMVVMANPMIFVYSISSADTEIMLPLAGTVDCTVDWGDGGDVETITSTYPPHTYGETGEYSVSITGTVTAIKSNYTNLTSTMKNLLIRVDGWGETGLTSMNDAFYGCGNLASVVGDENGAFADVTDFYGVFRSCKALTSVPADLFKYASKGTSFQDLFSSAGLTSVPSGLFDNCTEGQDFNSVFYGCSSLPSLPENLFAKCTRATTFAYAFYNCYKLASLPEGLFDNCTAVTTFESAFEDCAALAEIPEGLFANCSSVTTFESVFTGCEALKKVPNNLFADCSSVTTFSQAFNSCDELAEIGTGVFSGCVAVTDFSNVFQATAITSIPDGLFSDSPAVTTFQRAFYQCKSLTAIPEGLFTNKEKVTTFEQAFYQCSGLTSIPSGLFKGCTAVTRFYRTFYQCTGLTSIPEGLFADCKNVESFEQTFYRSTNLTGESAYDMVDGTMVHLYERTEDLGYTVPTSTGTCYNQCTGLNDYNEIPDSWK